MNLNVPQNQQCILVHKLVQLPLLVMATIPNLPLCNKIHNGTNRQTTAPYTRGGTKVGGTKVGGTKVGLFKLNKAKWRSSLKSF